MLNRKKARSVQFQLALRRINDRRTTELSAANWSLPKGDTNRLFPVMSHVHAVPEISNEDVHSHDEGMQM